MNILLITAFTLYILAIILLIHHYVIHGYLLDLHDVLKMNINSHEFWIIIFLITSQLLHYTSHIKYVKVTKKRIITISTIEGIILLYIFSSCT